MNTDILPSLKISSEYLQRENLRGYYVLDWIKGYVKKNKILFDTETRQRFTCSGLDDGQESYIVLRFKSENQKYWFVRQGNKRFPYFEFL